MAKPKLTKQILIKPEIEKKTWCLTTIVKNEEKLVTKFLESGKGFIDFVCLTDTGSVDKTKEIIEKWCEENKIPYKICDEEFRDFGYSRTKSLENAKLHFPQATYLVTYDLDMELEVLSGFDKNYMFEPWYRATQYNTNSRYTNTRFLRNDLDFEYKCRTHEYLSCKKDISYPGEIDSKYLQFKDNACGSNRNVKYERDIPLLLKDLEEKVCEDRSLYYLGQSYEGCGDNKRALEFYNRRVEIGGWEEERFMASFRMGKCYESMGKYNKAINQYLKAFNIRKTRKEPIKAICDICMKDGHIDNAKLYAFACLGAKVSNDVKDGLFIEKEAYETYYYIFYKTISCYYLGFISEGLEECKNLLVLNIPKWMRDRTEDNIKFYKK